MYIQSFELKTSLLAINTCYRALEILQSTFISKKTWCIVLPIVHVQVLWKYPRFVVQSRIPGILPPCLSLFNGKLRFCGNNLIYLETYISILLTMIKLGLIKRTTLLYLSKSGSSILCHCSSDASHTVAVK